MSKHFLIEGKFPVIGGGQSPLGYHNIYNAEKNTILISKDGAYAGFISKYDTKVFVSNHGIYISKIRENINRDYIYYYLKLIMQQKLYELQKGTAQPGVNKNDIEKLKIYIPSLDQQAQLITYLESNDFIIKQLENEIANNKEQAKYFLSSIVKKVNVIDNSISESGSEYESDTSIQSQINETEQIEKIIKTKTKTKTKTK